MALTRKPRKGELLVDSDGQRCKVISVDDGPHGLCHIESIFSVDGKGLAPSSFIWRFKSDGAFNNRMSHEQ